MPFRTLPTALALSHSLGLTSSASGSSSCSDSSTSRSTSSSRSQFSWHRDLSSSESQTDYDYSRPVTPKSELGERGDDDQLSGASVRLSFLNLEDRDDLEETPKPMQAHRLSDVDTGAEESDLDLGYESEAEQVDARTDRGMLVHNRVRGQVRNPKKTRNGQFAIRRSSGPEKQTVLTAAPPCGTGPGSTSRSRLTLLDLNSSSLSSSEDEHTPNQVYWQTNLNPPPKPRLDPQSLPEELSPIIDLPPLLLPIFPLPTTVTAGQHTRVSDFRQGSHRQTRCANVNDPGLGEKEPAGTVTIANALEDMLGFGYCGSASGFGQTAATGIPTPPDSEEEEDMMAKTMFLMAMRELDLVGRGVGGGLHDMV